MGNGMHRLGGQRQIMKGFRLNRTRAKVAVLATLRAVRRAVGAPPAIAAKDAVATAPVNTNSGSLDPIVQLILSLLDTLSLSALTSDLQGLNTTDLTQLLGAANPSQLTTILN